MRRRVVTFAVVFTGLIACGLDIAGSANDEGVSGPVPTEDASVEANATADSSREEEDAPVVPRDCPAVPGRACTDALPAGWRPVALSATECPPGHATHDGAGNPSAPDNACACTPSASVTDPPSCTRAESYKVMGNVTEIVTCTVASTSFPLEGCVNGLPASWNAAKFPEAKHLGACVPQCQVDPSKVTKTTLHLCEPTATCAEGTCAAAAQDAGAGGVRYCMAHEGDVACPADGGATAKTLFYEAFDVACEQAECENAIECTNRQVRLFTAPDCRGDATVVFTVDSAAGTCRPITKGQVKSFDYLATGTPGAGKITKAPKAILKSQSRTTICCRP
jgi:hypothetical protein